MRLKVKRAHMPYPAVRLPHGLQVVIEPDYIAEELIRRGFFEKDEEPKPPPLPAPAPAPIEEPKELKEIEIETVPETKTPVKKRGK